jgi:small GTP-binding protein
MADNVRVKSKVILLGDGAVGKTSLIRRYVLDQFKDEYIQTIGTKVTKKEIKITALNHQIVDTTMMIWDIMGQREYYKQHILQFNRYRPQTKYYMGTKGAIVVCDITRKTTLQNLPLWVNSIFEEVGPIPLIFLANKADLKDNYQFTLEDLAQFARQYNSPAFITSAKSSENVDVAFYKLGESMVNEVLKQEM